MSGQQDQVPQRDLIDRVADILQQWNRATLLMHNTGMKKLPSIAVEGLRAGSYWANQDNIRDYYAESVTDEGDQCVSVHVLLEDFDPDQLSPDYPGLEEPLTYSLNMSEEEVWHGWEGSDKTWEDSLDVIGSCRYEAAIPADRLVVELPDGKLLLASDFPVLNYAPGRP